MKRFYKAAVAEQNNAGWQVHLDGRPVKTQRGAAQIVPTQVLAEKLAREWANQGEKLDPASMPLRDLADVAIDIIAAGRTEAVGKLLSFVDTDTLCYRADPDEALFRRQRTIWDPILEQVEAREGITLRRVHGIIHKSHPQESIDALRAKLLGLDDFSLSGLTAMASLAASLCIALEALEDGADGAALWDATNLEEDWQIELWGADEEAAARRAQRGQSFQAALEFTRALQ